MSYCSYVLLHNKSIFNKSMYILVGKTRAKKEHSPHTRDDRYKRYVDDFPMTSDIKKKNDNDLLTVFFLDRGMRAFSKNLHTKTKR